MPTEKQIARRAKMKKGWNAFINFWKNLFQKIEENLPEIADIALKVMSGLKIGLNSGFVDFVTRLTKSGYDDQLVAKTKVAVEVIIDKILEGRECLENPTWEQKLECLGRLFANLKKEEQDDFYSGFHARLYAELDGNEKSQTEYRLETTAHYLIEKEAKKAA